MRARVGRRWIVLGAAGMGLIGGALTLVVAPSGYTATGALFAGVPPTSVADVGLAASSAVRSLPNVASSATAEAVLGPVVQSLRLTETSEQLAGRVTAGYPEGTAVVRVSVTDPDPQRAVRIDAATMQQMARMAESGRFSGAARLRLTVVESPSASTTASTRNVPIALLGGLGTGAGLGALIVLLPDLVRRRRPAGGGLSAPSMV